VTNNTPPVNDIKPTDTICENNSTCLGHYPEIKAYYDNIYQHVHKDDYDKLTFFDVEIVRLWLDYNITK
jgi:pterin-4a-carbinolamine dehydratase